MNVHKNAKLTPARRAQMVERLEAGEPVTEVADSIGVSRATAYKWYKLLHVDN